MVDNGWIFFPQNSIFSPFGQLHIAQSRPALQRRIRPAMTESIQHPALGKVTGKSEGGVVQYLGIKYATLKNRLADPELVVGSKYDHVDSTKTG